MSENKDNVPTNTGAATDADAAVDLVTPHEDVATTKEATDKPAGSDAATNKDPDVIPVLPIKSALKEVTTDPAVTKECTQHCEQKN